ncbi:MAG: patatin-like phospholipase family protein [Anaerolineales bacterium]
MLDFMKHPSFGIALGGGGARALAHIGVLKVLEREGIKPDFIVGTSMGGIIALAYANGATPGDLEAEALKMASLRQLVRLVDGFPPRRGLVQGAKLRQYFIDDIGLDTTFDDLTIPCQVCAVDLERAECVAIQEGLIVDAALATSAVPGLFPPVQLHGRKLVDGGLLDNVPVRLLEAQKVKRTLAVDVSIHIQPSEAEAKRESLPFLPSFSVDAINAIIVMTNAIMQYRLHEHPPDVLIQPHIPADIGILTGFTHAEEVISSGVKAAEAALPSIKRLL